MVAAEEAPGLAGLDSGSRTHDARESRFGRLYEDLVPGDRFRHWPGKTITEGDHHVFCLLTMSASPLHTDAEYARANMPGGVNIVLGSYVYALVLGMSVPDLSGRAVANLGLEKLSHLAPVHQATRSTRGQRSSNAGRRTATRATGSSPSTPGRSTRAMPVSSSFAATSWSRSARS